MLSASPYKTKTIHLKSGASLFFYTAGIPEAMDVSSFEYEEKRLLNSRHKSAATAQGITQAVISDVKTFSAGLAQSDDLTVLALY